MLMFYGSIGLIIRWMILCEARVVASYLIKLISLISSTSWSQRLWWHAYILKRAVLELQYFNFRRWMESFGCERKEGII
jgi:hypothetical protein